MKFFLASASPRRYEIMKMMPFEFEVHVPNFDERAYEQSLRERACSGTAERYDRSPADLTREIAHGKALCAYRELKEKYPAEEVLVLSADTIVVLDGEVFGKGQNREHSLEMLKRLNGRMHEVISAVWLVGDRPVDGAGTGLQTAAALAPREQPEVAESLLEVSKVYFADSDPQLLEDYVDRDQPFDKAGAYGIQDRGALLVERIEGNYHNIMGLPLRSVYLLLKQYLDPMSGREKQRGRITIQPIDAAMARAAAPLVERFRVSLDAQRSVSSQENTAAGERELIEFLGKDYPCFAALDGDRIIGYMVCRVEEESVWIEHLYVEPSHRRVGVASELFDRAEALAFSQGGETLFHNVHPTNDAVINFLRSKGYAVLNLIEIRKPFRGETPSRKIRVGDHEFDYS